MEIYICYQILKIIVFYNQIMQNPFLDGLTLSDGEPFLYCQELISLLKRVKATGLNNWSNTGFLEKTRGCIIYCLREKSIF
jgi:pyruvate-formate lyase-activating enzyme